ncbi:alcohol dehydrogenase, putative [Entamoeba invadens IP1]|uniref:Aldehyde-alcohol dehydrogenase n=2 Tax=Entamoeba invadens TaxID=33085 RepID=A0A0A1UDW7_ENTIV|nr:alcohol dehydrogenase, putative [Entamoeba invadens IP1]ELP94639.1 alcohol dehydrogenase, putative [Entamoeba invadens IP1]|eukprot:XP_004261410.1 alcohol dehydrogenase, putative [Entamoeba invadens IP1]
MATEQKMSVDEHINTLVANAQVALKEYLQPEFTQEKIDFIVKKASVAALDKHCYLAQLAVDETGRGVMEDKATKNIFACEHVTHEMRHAKTVGIVHEDPLYGITEIAEPVGVICGVTPVTNPTSTAIFKSLISIKTRNPIIFSFHPSALKCSIAAATIVRDAAIEAGAPKNCIQWIEFGGIEASNKLMNHAGIATILATGGGAMVKAAYSSGKPALGVGPGNVPSYIEKSCNLKQAINDVVLSKSFDNGMICASEQAAIIDKEIYGDAVAEFKRLHAYFVNDEEKAKLEKFMFGVNGYSTDSANARLNPKCPGMSPKWFAENAGFTIPDETSIICAECKEVGVKEPLTKEKLSPILAILKAENTADGFDKAEAMLEFGGLGHSAAIHSSDLKVVEQYALRMKACRILHNVPSSQGGIGGIYNYIDPSFTLGCGSYGGNSVSANVTYHNLLNIKRLAERRTNLQWFRVPPKIFFEPHAIRYLKELKELSKIFIVSDRMMYKLGYVDRVMDVLKRRQNDVEIEIFIDVEPDPSIQTVRKGLAVMNTFSPDNIIAIGGGSAMDAAKIMWLLYEHPEADFFSMKQKFLDLRKRAFKFPTMGKKARLICIPTTSGTGSEVTPFAVISDTETGKKYPLADYSLTPSVAIIDPMFCVSLPKRAIADCGIDVLVHAVEAYVSVMANEYTDGLAKEAVKLVFDNLVKSYNGDLVAREKMHNAATIAGMAFASAFLGIVHSMAHKVGAAFHLPHGRCVAVLLPHVIRYNGVVPRKLAMWPKYSIYVADQRYQQLAQLVGLKAETATEGVEVFAKACEKLLKDTETITGFKQAGIAEDVWMSHVKEMALLAFEDQCSPCNPRIPMVVDMEKILKEAYYPIA